MASPMTKIVGAGAQCRVKGPHIVKMGAPNICVVPGPPILHFNHGCSLIFMMR